MRIIKKFFKWVMIIMALLFIGGTIYVISVAKQAPTVTSKMLKMESKQCKIYDADDNLIYESQNLNQDYIPYSQISKQYQNALISTEDKNFWIEHGVSPIGTLKGIISVLIHGGIGANTVGGSTITQQLVKLSVFSTSNKDRTIRRKIQDIWISLQLSYRVPKQKILEYYVNRMYEGQNVYGAETISKVYYNKSLKDLDLSQTAYIAGIGQAPSYYNLYKNPKACEIRRNDVLLSMLNNKKITKTQYENAKAEPIQNGLIPQEQSFKIRYQEHYPNFNVNKDYLRSVFAQLDKNNIKYRNCNIKVYTNLDSNAQQIAYNAINTNGVFNQNGMQNKQAAMTLVNPNNGAVVAQIGGRDLNGQPNQINRAVEANRSCGSTIKPILDYAPAIEFLNWDENHQVDDSPYKYKGTDIQVHDWDNKYEGKMSMRDALIQSRNVPAIRTFLQVGSEQATTFMNQFGIQSVGNATPAQAIGIAASTVQLAGAYDAFSTGGIYHKPSYINTVKYQNDDGDWQTVHLNDNKGGRIMKSSTAYIINDILKATINDANGSAHDSQINGLNQAGKSGTVSSDVTNLDPNAVTDVWMCGYTPVNSSNNSGYSCSVWVGADKPNYPDGKIPQNCQNAADEVYKQIMFQIATKQQNSDWKMPDTVTKSGNDLKPNDD